MSSTNPDFPEKQQNQLQDEKELQKCKKDLVSKIKEINNAIAKEGENLSRIQAVYDADKLQLDTLVTKTDHQEASLQSHSNQNEVMSTAENDELVEKNMNLQSEVSESQDLLMKVKLLQSTVFQMSPSWWQQAQNVKAKDPQKEQNSESKQDTSSGGMQVLTCLVTTRKERDKKLMLQATGMKAKLEREKEKAEMFKEQVESHKHAKDPAEVLDHEVTGVFSQCRVRRLTSLSTLEKMQFVEHHVNELITQAEKIPVEHLKRKRQKNLREKKKREQEERLRLEMEKHREKMDKYMKKAMEKSPKTNRRTLMPRSNPDHSKVKGASELDGPAQHQQEDPFSSSFEL